MKTTQEFIEFLEMKEKLYQREAERLQDEYRMNMGAIECCKKLTDEMRQLLTLEGKEDKQE